MTDETRRWDTVPAGRLQVGDTVMVEPGDVGVVSDLSRTNLALTYTLDGKRLFFPASHFEPVRAYVKF